MKKRKLRKHKIGTYIRGIEQLNWSVDKAYELLHPLKLNPEEGIYPPPPFQTVSHKLAMDRFLVSIQDYRRHLIKKVIKKIEEKIYGKKTRRKIIRFPNFRKS